MTQVTITDSNKLAQSTPTLTYSVKMTQASLHLFEVSLHIENWTNTVLNLKMPVWTPGSYLVREYARHI
ncbi:MAG: peptidase M61, partial [Crocosphaera sp.]